MSHAAENAVSTGAPTRTERRSTTSYAGMNRSSCGSLLSPSRGRLARPYRHQVTPAYDAYAAAANAIPPPSHRKPDRMQDFTLALATHRQAGVSGMVVIAVALLFDLPGWRNPGAQAVFRRLAPLALTRCSPR